MGWPAEKKSRSQRRTINSKYRSSHYIISCSHLLMRLNTDSGGRTQSVDAKLIELVKFQIKATPSELQWYGFYFFSKSLMSGWGHRGFRLVKVELVLEERSKTSSSTPQRQKSNLSYSKMRRQIQNIFHREWLQEGLPVTFATGGSNPEQSVNCGSIGWISIIFP